MKANNDQASISEFEQRITNLALNIIDSLPNYIFAITAICFSIFTIVDSNKSSFIILLFLVFIVYATNVVVFQVINYKINLLKKYIEVYNTYEKPKISFSNYIKLEYIKAAVFLISIFYILLVVAFISHISSVLKILTLVIFLLFFLSDGIKVNNSFNKIIKKFEKYFDFILIRLNVINKTKKQKNKTMLRYMA